MELIRGPSEPHFIVFYTSTANVRSSKELHLDRISREDLLAIDTKSARAG